MSYIGNPVLYQAFVTDQFSGNGSTTTFTMSVSPANTASVLVSVSGVLQDPTTYAVSGTTLTFSAAPPSGTANISVRYLGIPASGVTNTAYRTVTEFTATAAQTTFSVPSYTVGFINVYRNGVRLGAADFTATNGTSVVLTSAANSGDLVVTESFYVSSVLNAIPGSPGSVVTANLADQAVTPAKLSTGAPTWDASGRLFTPNQIHARVSRNSGTVTAGNVVVFNYADDDPAGVYSTSTGRFTAPVTGRYLSCHGLFSNSGYPAWVKWRVNGSIIATTYTNVTSGYSSVAGSIVLRMNAGDYLDIYVETGGYAVYGGDRSQCWATFTMLG